MNRLHTLFKTENRIYLFILPSLVGLSVFYLIPFVISIYMALIDNIVARNFVGFTNLISILDNGAYKLAIKNTLLFMGISVPLNMLLPLMLALIMRIMNKSVRRAFVLLFLMPLVVPSGSVVFFWEKIFAMNGMINRFFFVTSPVDWLNTDFALVFIVLIFLWKNAGFNMILYQAGLDFIPLDYYEYASMEGAGAVRKFFIVTLTYLTPTALLVFMLSVVNSFKVFKEIYMLTGAYPYRSVYLLQHFLNNQFAALNYQKLSSASIFVFAFIVVLVILLYRLQQRQTYL